MPDSPSEAAPRVAYFSMEIAFDAGVPSYAGGLGVLAGDSLRAAADLGMPLVGVTLVHRAGYFRQHIDDAGRQHESPATWDPGQYASECPARTSITLEGRTVHIRAWRYEVRGARGVVPVYLLDTDLPENDPADRDITDSLYGGDARDRLRQEAVLGMGGVAMLRALGVGEVTYHLNEGHSALLAVALMCERLGHRGQRELTEKDIAAIRSHCVFTTHTPVPEGHDQFPLDLVAQVLGDDAVRVIAAAGASPSGMLNLTYLALACSRYVNGVAIRHGEVSRGMFPGYPIGSITNGVHAATWTSQPFQALFDRQVPNWRGQNSNLRYATCIPVHEVQEAHAEAKDALLAELGRRTGRALSPSAMTIGFARRATAYKRPTLLFQDVERLRAIGRTLGPLQVLFAGKAHPRDEAGKALIQQVHQVAAVLEPDVPILYLEDYDTSLAHLLCSGVDLWLNTPQRPNEASGTSGMKAALNGVPSLSVLDGWWVEGHIEGVTGWSIGESRELAADPAADAPALYEKLEHVILPMFFGAPTRYGEVMRSSISLNGSFFNAERMLLQYAQSAYRL